MFIVTRRYQLGEHPIKEAVERTQEAFAPLLEKMPGFHDYYYVHSEGSVMTIGVFESRDEAEESTRIAAKWIKENIPDLYAGPPEIFSGEVKIHLEPTEGISKRPGAAGPSEHARM